VTARGYTGAAAGRTNVQIIDAQVHAYERNHPGRPWVGHLHGPPSATGDEMVAAMDTAGVDGALLLSIDARAQ
jgi:L-fuconolactonase